MNSTDLEMGQGRLASFLGLTKAWWLHFLERFDLSVCALESIQTFHVPSSKYIEFASKCIEIEIFQENNSCHATLLL